MSANFSIEDMEELDRLLAGEREALHVHAGRITDLQQVKVKVEDARNEVERWTRAREEHLQKMVTPK